MEIRKRLSVFFNDISSSTLLYIFNVYFLASVLFAQGMGSFSTAEGFIYIFMFNSTKLSFPKLDLVVEKNKHVF